MTRIRNTEPMEVSKEGDNLIMKTTGSLRIDLERIRAVAIANIVRLKSYDLKDGEDFIIHTIAWRNGGTARLAFSISGKLMEFKVKGIAVSVENDVITLDVDAGT